MDNVKSAAEMMEEATKSMTRALEEMNRVKEEVESQARLTCNRIKKASMDAKDALNSIEQTMGKVDFMRIAKSMEALASAMQTIAAVVDSGAWDKVAKAMEVNR